MPNINFCNNTGNFVPTEVDANTVGELRVEMGLPTEAINVNRVVADDDQSLQDGYNVAAVKTNMKGGK